MRLPVSGRSAFFFPCTHRKRQVKPVNVLWKTKTNGLELDLKSALCVHVPELDNEL